MLKKEILEILKKSCYLTNMSLRQAATATLQRGGSEKEASKHSATALVAAGGGSKGGAGGEAFLTAVCVRGTAEEGERGDAQW